MSCGQCNQVILAHQLLGNYGKHLLFHKCELVLMSQSMYYLGHLA